jgi:hypothetical protein
MKSSSTGVQQNLFCNFWTLLQVSTNFGSLPYFLEFKTMGKRFKIARIVSGRNPARGYSVRRGGLPRAIGWKAGWAMAWWPGSAAEAARACRCGHRARDGTVALSPVARRRLTGGKVLD